jgi:hypothetical protein
MNIDRVTTTQTDQNPADRGPVPDERGRLRSADLSNGCGRHVARIVR